MQIGQEFQNEVYEKVKEEILSGRTGFDPRNAKVHPYGKRYYSRDRQGDIIVDTAVELFRSGQSKPFLIWILECKDLGRKVSVDDVEEFHSKLDQIGADKTKGTIVARGEFQKAALTYAESKGISVWRLLPEGTMISLVEAVGRVDIQVEAGLMQSNLQSLRSTLFAVSTSGERTLDLTDAVAFELDVQ